MKKLTLTFFFLMTINVVFSQNDSKAIESEIFQKKLIQTSKTLVINTTSIPESIITTFNLELEGWKHKIVSVEVDSVQKHLVIIHNGLLHPKELELFFTKYQITKAEILSYK